jgi:hypothetical protein
MDTQETRLRLETPALAYCTCCTPRQLLIPRDDGGTPGRWAVCVATGAWYENRGDGVFAAAPAPRPGEVVEMVPTPAPRGLHRADQWADGDGLPAIVPGVRIDLSKESYA